MSIAFVSGAVANKPHNGGEAWVRLSWAVGLQRLGFQVYFVEQLAPELCQDADGAPVPFEDCGPAKYFHCVTNSFGLAGRASLIDPSGERTIGLCWPELLKAAAAAELLVNISGHLTSEALLRRIRRKVYVDIDPGFTQLWAVQGLGGSRLCGHEYHFTIGENIGTPACPIPADGIRWRRTRQPVVLDHWPLTSADHTNRFTTIANWRGPYGPIEHQGKTFGLKVHEFRKFLELPRRAPGVFEIALNIHPADARDREALQSHGWNLTDPLEASSDPDAFRRYVQGSAAEFSVAQGIYVDTSSGWFSDRSVRYLASGKPVLVQETGFSRTLPVGAGLLSFRTLDEAVAGAERIVRDYDAHARAARAIAERYFDSDIVLGRLLDEVGVAP
jgi:hypothetical protein